MPEYGNYSPYSYLEPAANRQYVAGDAHVNRLLCLAGKPSSRLCPGSSAWLLVPTGIGIVGALLIALSHGDPGEGDRKLRKKEAAVIVLYTAFASFTFSLHVYCTLKNRRHRLASSFLPLSVGLGLQLLFFGTVYFLIYRLEPSSFNANINMSLAGQLFEFIFFSIAVFATGEDGQVSALSLFSKSVVGIEYLTYIYIFVLGLVLLTG